MSNPEAFALNLSLREFLDAVEHQAKPLVIPLCAELPLPDLSPPALFSSLQTGKGFLLESREGSEKIARYSYIGIDPTLIVALGDTPSIEGKEPYLSIARNPEGSTAIDMLRSILYRFNFVNIRAPRFFGGLVGYLSYDLVYSLYGSLLTTQKPASDEPIALFMMVKDCLVLDHCANRMFIFSSPLLLYESDVEEEFERSRERILALARIIPRLEELPTETSPSGQPHLAHRTNLSRDEFCGAVHEVKRYIRAGDIFQAVVSRRIDLDLDVSPFSVYRALRAINPSPYQYYLDFGDRKVLGASPEMLVRVERRNVTTVPIAGTRPRGKTKDEEDLFRRELLADEKERAEHTMLVDLARNDVGRIARFRSIRVEDFMSIERFSHVQHMVSTVRGTLRNDRDGYDALVSCFPAGTVSGAPKLRAMQIIDELEPDRRGVYAGAVGYLGFDRNLEFAITIRTVVVQGKKASIQVGAGIVSDSIPENEYQETEIKAQAMLQAIGAAERYS
ncbi:MAG: anthranilate synthase component I family protein [Methanomicrobiales archaeon]|nr:anthranilate synthase component I family protein [Methanomicrobiales archaeon]